MISSHNLSGRSTPHARVARVRPLMFLLVELAQAKLDHDALGSCHVAADVHEDPQVTRLPALLVDGLAGLIHGGHVSM